jgi:DNA repair photolyase
MVDALPNGARGRGARSNADGRYERLAREAFDDGWTAVDAAPRRIETELRPERAKTIISRNDSPDISFDRSINTYRGCEHGCIYCYARPNHAYVGLSPGLDFESKIFFKTDAAALLKKELAAPNYACATMVMGGVTDVYQPAEKTQRVTRSVLEVLRDHNHPVAIITKSALVLRDLDLLAPMAALNLAKVAVSVTTLDRKLARAMEPRAATPARRLEAIAGLASAGVPVSVMTAPIIPALTDHEMESILAAAAAASAREAGYVLLRLPLEIKDLFEEWLHAAAPDRAAHVMSVIRQMRRGKAYDSRWGLRQKGEGPFAALLAARFRRACAQLGLNQQRIALDCTQFRPPPKAGDQLSLL